MCRGERLVSSPRENTTFEPLIRSMLILCIAEPFSMIIKIKIILIFFFFFDRCAGAGYTSRWYHMSDGEHFCNACFDYMYRRSVTCQCKVPLPHFVNIIPLKCTLGNLKIL